jgi:hypothetical protein
LTCPTKWGIHTQRGYHLATYFFVNKLCYNNVGRVLELGWSHIPIWVLKEKAQPSKGVGLASNESKFKRIRLPQCRKGEEKERSDDGAIQDLNKLKKNNYFTILKKIYSTIKI